MIQMLSGICSMWKVWVFAKALLKEDLDKYVNVPCQKIYDDILYNSAYLVKCFRYTGNSSGAFNMCMKMSQSKNSFDTPEFKSFLFRECTKIVLIIILKSISLLTFKYFLFWNVYEGVSFS